MINVGENRMDNPQTQATRHRMKTYKTKTTQKSKKMSKTTVTKNKTEKWGFAHRNPTKNRSGLVSPKQNCIVTYNALLTLDEITKIMVSLKTVC